MESDVYHTTLGAGALRMRTVFGWFIPGAGAWLQRRYLKAVLVFVAVCGTFAAGLALQGGNLWPTGEELRGLDGSTALAAWGGAFARSLAGGPWLLAHLLGYSESWISGRVHELGTTLLTVAGLINLLALAENR